MDGLPPPLSAIPPQIAGVADYEPYARERMSTSAWAYLNGGAADGFTVAENRAAFDRIRLLPRVLNDLSGAHTRLNLLGHDYEHPILLAPVAYQKLAHPQGELATVLAAAAMQAGTVLSAQASVSLEEVASHAPAPLWMQLYLQYGRDFVVALVRRAEAAGYRALVVTVDAPVNGVRNEEQRAGFVLPDGVSAVNLRELPAMPAHQSVAGESPLFGSALLAMAPCWRDIEWLRSITALPLLLKGVAAPADALHAIEAGVDGLIVSNHGGRTLDTLPATIELLPPIATAVAGRMPLLLDGGVRRGTDILKALALGASAVLVGRPYVHALAAAGAPGVAHVLHILRAELEAAMALSGCRTLADIDASILWPPDAVRWTSSE